VHNSQPSDVCSWTVLVLAAVAVVIATLQLLSVSKGNINSYLLDKRDGEARRVNITPISLESYLVKRSRSENIGREKSCYV